MGQTHLHKEASRESSRKHLVALEKLTSGPWSALWRPGISLHAIVFVKLALTGCQPYATSLPSKLWPSGRRDKSNWTISGCWSCFQGKWETQRRRARRGSYRRVHLLLQPAGSCEWHVRFSLVLTCPVSGMVLDSQDTSLKERTDERTREHAVRWAHWGLMEERERELGPGLSCPLRPQPKARGVPLFETFGVPTLRGRSFAPSHFTLVAPFPEDSKGNEVATGYFLERIEDNYKRVLIWSLTTQGTWVPLWGWEASAPPKLCSQSSYRRESGPILKVPLRFQPALNFVNCFRPTIEAVAPQHNRTRLYRGANLGRMYMKKVF